MEGGSSMLHSIRALFLIPERVNVCLLGSPPKRVMAAFYGRVDGKGHTQPPSSLCIRECVSLSTAVTFANGHQCKAR